MNTQPNRHLDATDNKILSALGEVLRPSISDLARAIAVARGTVHTRLDRLRRDGVIHGYCLDVDTGLVGFPVRAFTTVSIVQGQLEQVLIALRHIPEVLEAHVITGRGDLLLGLAARSNDHLHDVLQAVASIAQVSDMSTQLALASPLKRSVTTLVGLGVNDDMSTNEG